MPVSTAVTLPGTTGTTATVQEVQDSSGEQDSADPEGLASEIPVPPPLPSTTVPVSDSDEIWEDRHSIDWERIRSNLSPPTSPV